MKALNLKKSALAVALAATAGSAVAANTVNVITGDVDTMVAATSALTTAQKAYVSVAKELAGNNSARFVEAAAAATGATAGTTEAQANTAMVRLAMQVVPTNNQYITVQFANGGARFETGANLVAYNSGRNAFQNFLVAPQVVSQPTISGTDTTATSVTFKLEDVTISDTTNSDEIGTDDFIFLIDGTMPATGTPIATATLQGPDFYVNPGVAAGAKVSVDVILKDTSNQNEIANSNAAAVNFAEAYTSLKVNELTTAQSKVIDYAADALKFTGNTTTVSRTATDYVANVAVSSTLQAADTANVPYGAKVFGSFDLTADKCAAVDTSDDSSTSATPDVVLFGHNATASSVKSCTWGVSAKEITVDGDPVVSVKVDGKTVIENSSWSYTGTLTLGSADTSATTKTDINKAWMNVSGNIFTFTSDVQGEGIQLPYVYHVGTGTGYSSFIKVTNKKARSTSSTATNNVELAFNAVIKNTVTGDQFKVENYKLGMIENEGQAEFSGASIIEALKTPLGKASDGFNETAMDLDTAQNYHIALELIPRNQSSNDLFFVDVQNTSPVGRAQGSVEYTTH